jgi:hypothetical protein
MVYIIDFIRELSPLFFSIFGTTVAITEFFLPEKTQESLKIFFMKIWDILDEIATKLVEFFHSSAASKPFLVVCGIIVQILFGLDKMSAEFNAINPRLMFWWMRLDFWIIIAVISIINWIAWIAVRKEVIYPIVKRGFSFQNPIDSGAYFFQYNLIVAMFLTSLEECAKFYGQMRVGYMIMLAFIFPVGYICGFSLALFLVCLIYYPCYVLIWLLEFTMERLIDFKKGPVLAVSLTIAACGAVIEFVLKAN